LADRVIRPANFPASVPGHGSKLLTLGTKSILVVNLLGRVFVKTLADDPFRTFDDVLRAHAAAHPSLVLVDFHAEATSEKIAMGWHVAGRAAALWGTHTHVPTADARILPGGTAYITDVGMTGFKDGVIGITKEPILANFKTQLPVTHELPDRGEAIVSTVLIEIEGREAKSITAHHRTCAF
jgi:metallophosphoesterase (TIGR00282 family)